MKNLKFFALLLAFFLVLPLAVFADEATEESKEVNVYLFRGEGCPHCAEAEEWFKSIEEEYGDLFNVVDYETWYDEENAELMQRVADAREEKAEGVPYIIIGNKSWNGFAESYEEEMLELIAVNPGMERRFPYQLHFEDYNEDELMEIFRSTSKVKVIWGKTVRPRRARTGIFKVIGSIESSSFLGMGKRKGHLRRPFLLFA